MDIRFSDNQTIYKQINITEDLIFEIQGDISIISYKASKIQTILQFEKDVVPDIEAFVNRYSTYIKEEIALDVFKETVLELFTNQFKGTYLKLIIFKSVIYAVFRKKFAIIDLYLNYHTPEDAEATISNPDYSIQSVDEIFAIILLQHEIINDYKFFWIENHGFGRYFNTIIFYLLSRYDYKHLRDRITAISDTGELNSYMHYFKFALGNFDKIALENLAGNNWKDKMVRLSLLSEIRFHQLEQERLKNANIDEDVNIFAADFNSSFLKKVWVRNILSHYSTQVENFTSDVEVVLQTSFTTSKKFFAPNASVSTFISGDITNTPAEHLAKEEENFIIANIVGKAEPIQLDVEKKLPMILDQMKKRFDLAFVYGKYRVMPKILEDAGFNEISGEHRISKNHRGKLMDHYEVFAFGNELNFIILLNSQNLCKLSNLSDDFPPEFWQEGELFFRKEEYRQGSEIRIWIQVVEKIRLSFPENFHALKIQWGSSADNDM